MNEFQQVIKAYLDQRAQEDAQFADNYAKKGKSIEKCCNYILRQAKKRGNAVAMPDDEVFGLAVHYYDEDIPADECKPVSGASRAYYDGADSLILSAKDRRGKRIETVEFDLRRGRVVQSRGRFNKLTERHDDIVNLCNNNAKTILAARQP